MPNSKLALFLAIVLAAALAAQAPARHSVTIPVEFRPALSPDRWDNGYWIQFERSVNPGDRPQVWMYDRDGHLVIQKTGIWFPGAYHVKLDSVAAVGDGSLVASVESWRSPGELATLLLHIVPPGKIASTIVTSQFAADSLVVKDRSEIWAFGGTPIHKSAPQNPDTLERFSLDGKLLSKGLPASTYFSDSDRRLGLPSKVQSNGQRAEAYATWHGQAVILDNGVGFFSPVSSSWLELSPTGDLKSRLTLPNPFHSDSVPAAPQDPFDFSKPGPYAAGALAFAGGQVYAHLFEQHLRQDRSRYQGAFTLDRDSARWVPVSDTYAGGFGGLYGADGGSLIARSGCCTYAWFDPPKPGSARASR